MPAPLNPDHDHHAQEQAGDPDSELTRRHWFIKVGQTAVAIGLTDGLEAQAPGKPVLPAGLYDPSTDHLAHALMGNTRFHPIPPGSPTDYVAPRSESFVPQFFSESEFAVVRRMVEIMLGETSPPAGGTGPARQEQGDLVKEVAAWIDLSVFSAAGIREANLKLSAPHRALAVAYYGESEVRSLETSDPQKLSREGLEWLTGFVKDRYRSDFLSLKENDQLEILRAIADGHQNKHSENAGTRFFKLIKHEFIRGFYTSSVGLKELDYKGNAFYAQSPGCKKQ